jgi:sec-independent protein translocase protein TatB
MFGMGFTEILIIAVIAILFLGPDKLPSTMVEIAKFFRSVKNTIGSVKDSIEEEMNVSEIKKEALAYKQELLNAGDSLNRVTNIQANINKEIDNVLNENQTPATSDKAPNQAEEVTFKKIKKSKKEDSIDV